MPLTTDTAMRRVRSIGRFESKYSELLIAILEAQANPAANSHCRDPCRKNSSHNQEYLQCLWELMPISDGERHLSDQTGSTHDVYRECELAAFSFRSLTVHALSPVAIVANRRAKQESRRRSKQQSARPRNQSSLVFTAIRLHGALRFSEFGSAFWEIDSEVEFAEAKRHENVQRCWRCLVVAIRVAFKLIRVRYWDFDGFNPIGCPSSFHSGLIGTPRCIRAVGTRST